MNLYYELNYRYIIKGYKFYRNIDLLTLKAQDINEIFDIESCFHDFNHSHAIIRIKNLDNENYVIVQLNAVDVSLSLVGARFGYGLNEVSINNGNTTYAQKRIVAGSKYYPYKFNQIPIKQIIKIVESVFSLFLNKTLSIDMPRKYFDKELTKYLDQLIKHMKNGKLEVQI